MKCLPVLICALAVCNISAAQKPFVLKGSLTGKDTGIVYLKYNRAGFIGTDSVRLENNAFVFKGLLAEPVLASLTFRPDPRSARTELYTDFYLEAKNIEVELTWTKPAQTVVKNSSLNANYQQLKLLSEADLFDIYRLEKEVAFDAAKSDSLKFLRSRSRRFLNKVISANRSSVVSAHATLKLINSQGLSVDSAIILLESLEPAVKKSAYCSNLINQFSMTANAAIGRAAPLFVRTDINGKKFSLNDLKGKYVLLEYWASWCGPCREMTPTIKENHRKYRDLGFEVVFISCDSKYDAWKKAVADDGIGSFINVLSFTKEDMEYLKTNSNMQHASFKGELRRLYNLNPIPAKILIDREGKIIGRYGDQGGEPNETLETKLASLKK